MDRSAPDASATRSDNQRLGVLGGTFDPIHHGHIQMAVHAQRALDLDRVVFLPTPTPSHREPPTASFGARCQMTQLGIAPHKFCELYRLEQACSEAQAAVMQSKTRHTLGKVKHRYGHTHTYFFLLGQDSFIELHNWYQAAELYEMCQFLVFKRSDQTITPPPTLINALGEAQEIEELIRSPKGWGICGAPALDISSSCVRAWLSQLSGDDKALCQSAAAQLERWIPGPVLDFVHKRALYRPTQSMHPKLKD